MKKIANVVRVVVIVAMSSAVFAGDAGQRNTMPDSARVQPSKESSRMNTSGSGAGASNVQGTNKNRASNFIEQIEGIQTIQKATVVLAPPNSSYLVTLNEETLKKVGCTFITRDSSHIASLIELLKRANVRAGSDGFWGEPREGIYLTLANGTEVSFLFGDRRGQDTVGGLFFRLRGFETPVIADQALPQELFLWGKKTNGLVANTLCEAIIKDIGVK